MKKIYISTFSGLGNRLETLVIAALIADRWGHSIFLDWREKESLRVAGTERGWLKPWERIGMLKLRDFDEARLATLGERRVISLRSTYGPRELQRRHVLPTAASGPTSRRIRRRSRASCSASSATGKRLLAWSSSCPRRARW